MEDRRVGKLTKSNLAAALAGATLPGEKVREKRVK